MAIPEHLLFLDIETLPTDREDLIAEIVADIAPPGNLSKAETIAAWWETKGAEAKLEAVRKTSLDGGTGRLASVAWAWGAAPVVSAHTAVDGKHDIEFERTLISGFFAEACDFKKRLGTPPTICGHKVTGFDIRWIWHRAIVLGLTPPWWWPVNAKPWDQDAIQDTMTMWSGARDRISQDRLARLLGLGGKGAVDGSKVAGMWDEGRFEEIREYNADDVRTARAIWCRIAGEPIPVEEEVVEEKVEVFSIESEAANGTTATVEIFIPDVLRPADPAPVDTADETPPDPRKVLPPFLLDIARRGYSA